LAHKNLAAEPNPGSWPDQWHFWHWSRRSRYVLERALDLPGTTTDGPGLSRSFDHCAAQEIVQCSRRDRHQ
jgi:hypothetical protein